MREEDIRKEYQSETKNPILKLIRWFQGYWYYYNIPILAVAGVLLLVGAILTSVLGKEKIDYTVAVVSCLSVDQEDFETVKSNFAAVLPDVNEDGKVNIELNCIQIDTGMTDEFSVAAHDAVTAMLLYDKVAFFLVDDYCSQYLEDILAIEPLSVLGIEGGDTEYRVNISETSLLDNTSVDEYIDYYLVVKKLGDADRDNEEYLARRAGIAPMLLEVAQ